ncbi:MAG: alpha/beta fold hydrolase [Gammaproteobacteria bacterium]|nr:alpha/beta fold hydrolase [Gammaproteobacteria bacterium]
MAMRLHWQVHPGTGPYLLLVHGFLMGPNQWHPNLAALGAVCQPVVVDLLGHGDSPAPVDVECYRPSAYVKAFEAIRQALGAERWFLCGYSLGAGLTVRYALTHLERVIGHAFTNSTSALADAEQVALWRDEAEASAARILAGGSRAIERIPVHPRFAKRIDPASRALVLADATRLKPQGVANAIRCTTPEASVRSELGGNPRPALLLNGARETRFQPHRQFVADHMRQVRIVDLDAGHAVNLEAADAFNRALAEFVEQCPIS